MELKNQVRTSDHLKHNWQKKIGEPSKAVDQRIETDRSTIQEKDGTFKKAFQ